jgi:acetolactate decarboxylase
MWAGEGNALSFSDLGRRSSLRGEQSVPFINISRLVGGEQIMAERVQHTLYQVSTATALVEGIYQGAVQVAALREHGDLGLGTFEGLDGEMVVVDGHFFQVRSDGSVREVQDNVLSPFAAVTAFSPDQSITLENCPDLSYLTSQFDTLRQSDNFFFALRVDGTFDYIHARAMRRTKEGVPLVQAAAVQPEFEFNNISGTLVGFWTPEYAKSLNVPGYHVHFISGDRTRGGHLLQCRGKNLRLQIQREGDYHIVLPETADFLKANLRRDPTAALAKAEGEKK